MINLLPNKYKESVAFAKKNSLLLNWSVIITVCFLGLYSIIGIGLIYLSNTVESVSLEVQKQSEELGTPEVKESKEKLQLIQANTDLAVDVLSRQILFSELIASTGAILPEGVILNNLSLGNDSEALTLSFNTTSKESGSQIIANLQDENNGVFASADLNTLSCDESKSATYPCVANVTALLDDTNKFRLQIETSDSSLPTNGENNE